MALDSFPQTPTGYLAALTAYNKLPSREQKVTALCKLLKDPNYRKSVGKVSFGNTHWQVACEQKSIAQDMIGALGCFFDDWQPNHNQPNELRHIYEAEPLAKSALAGFRKALKSYELEEEEFSDPEYLLNREQEEHLQQCRKLIEDAEKEVKNTGRLVELIDKMMGQINQEPEIKAASKVMPTVDEQERITAFEQQLEQLEAIARVRQLARQLEKFVKTMDKDAIDISYNRSDYGVGFWNLAKKLKKKAKRDYYDEFPYLEAAKQAYELAEYCYTSPLSKQQCQRKVGKIKLRLAKLDQELTQEEVQREREAEAMKLVTPTPDIQLASTLANDDEEGSMDSDSIFSHSGSELEVAANEEVQSAVCQKEQLNSISQLSDESGDKTASRKRPLELTALVEADSTTPIDTYYIRPNKKFNQ
ncbi:hypothetical protein [Parashewanella tropica]|uniref:hypothetical protein n=1 Tax=Parashewanella tropica TaxID=2547970 RepID=UPI00105998AC|nr:hypothetical protein [Parashewanella tropica]